MNEQELRAIVRQAVARHMGDSTSPSRHVATSPSPHLATSPSPHLAISPSHHLYQGLVNVSDACVIEPAVPCDHCGYCKSHGH